MKKPLAALLAWSLLLTPAWADTLDNIKKRGTLVAGVMYASPPFGVLNPKTQTISGYDVDFAAAIAKRLGVKLLAQAVDPADRIPKLQDGSIDLVLATFTKNAEREKQVDFSIGYFVTGQKFLVHKGKVRSLDDLEKGTIGVAKGTTSEQQLRREMPKAKIKLFDSNKDAAVALSGGTIDAMTSDEPILAGQLSQLPNRKEFEISNVSISLEIYAVAMKKGEKRLQKEVNDTLVEMEKTGEAKRVFEYWFNENGPAPMMRSFSIMPL
ncbi:transporter substrate-binding domain-containing protein [Parachitinimonas caeni]|uniref:Transporter substrate-binding domain-containing protein n=1 Tax=Parachitinimonas caeni TaxID=3031301 RepID=A0ABT7E3I0_9NEIS|nr:transporter substrate-binding domain-containing protein [Parachitinimonas caeni]MDK2126870.1 transporter substrate-binding domain-containing protein [Parachitinimonas caeni]